MARDNPEGFSKSPEFIKVLYDESGKPIGVKPADVKAEERMDGDSKTIVQKVPIFSNDLRIIGNWLSAVNANVNSLRASIGQRTDGEVDKKLDLIDGRISILAKEIGNTILMDNRLSEEMILLREKMERLKIPDIDLLRVQIDSMSEANERKMKDVEANLSSLQSAYEQMRPQISAIYQNLSEMHSSLESDILSAERQLSTKTDQTNEKIFSLENRITESQTMYQSLLQRMSEIQNDIERIQEDGKRFDNLMTKEEFEKINQENKNKFNSLISREDLEKMKSDFEMSLILNRLDYEVMLKGLKRKTVRKIKRRIRKRKIVKKAKKFSFRANRIEKLLKAKYKMKPDEKVLIVSEKRLAKYGRAVYNVARKIDKNSVFMTVENRKNQKEEFGSTVEKAMKNSHLVLVSSRYSLKRTNVYKIIRKARVRIAFFNKRLQFST